MTHSINVAAPEYEVSVSVQVKVEASVSVRLEDILFHMERLYAMEKGTLSVEGLIKLLNEEGSSLDAVAQEAGQALVESQVMAGRIGEYHSAIRWPRYITSAGGVVIDDAYTRDYQTSITRKEKTKYTNPNAKQSNWPKYDESDEDYSQYSDPAWRLENGWDD